MRFSSISRAVQVRQRRGAGSRKNNHPPEAWTTGRNRELPPLRPLLPRPTAPSPSVTRALSRSGRLHLLCIVLPLLQPTRRKSKWSNQPVLGHSCYRSIDRLSLYLFLRSSENLDFFLVAGGGFGGSGSTRIGSFCPIWLYLVHRVGSTRTSDRSAASETPRRTCSVPLSSGSLFVLCSFCSAEFTCEDTEAGFLV